MRIDQDMFDERSLRVWIEEGTRGTRKEAKACQEGEKRFEEQHL
jgi:hypothetical protein